MALQFIRESTTHYSWTGLIPGEGGSFPCRLGVAQGGKLSPKLFNIALEFILYNDPLTKKIIEEGRFQCFADDMIFSS